jgi:hypothetical protein
LSDQSIRTIEGVRSSSGYIFNSFKKKIDSLRAVSSNINKLLRFGIDYRLARKTAIEFFGNDTIDYIAVDGTDAFDEELDLLVFYVGAFGYKGSLRFKDDGAIMEGPKAVEDFSVSAAIPISEEDASTIFGSSTESGVEVDPQRLPGSIMHLAEYYLTYKALTSDPSIKVALLDRTLAGDMGHLIWSTKELIDNHACILENMETPYGRVTMIYS